MAADQEGEQFLAEQARFLLHFKGRSVILNSAKKRQKIAQFGSVKGRNGLSCEFTIGALDGEMIEIILKSSDFNGKVLVGHQSGWELEFFDLRAEISVHEFIQPPIENRTCVPGFMIGTMIFDQLIGVQDI